MKPLRILIADDHELVRRGVRGLLQAQRGWIVVGEAATGREAVEKAKTLKPDIVVIDVSLPELDGLQATRQLKRKLQTVRLSYLRCMSRTRWCVEYWTRVPSDTF